MIIHVYTGDYRSFGNSSELWGGETIPVEVDDNFTGGAKSYSPESKLWVGDSQHTLTAEDYIREAELERQNLLAIANDRINRNQWPGKAAMKRLTPVEFEKYNLWLDYLDALAVVDVSAAPDVSWPEKP